MVPSGLYGAAFFCPGDHFEVAEWHMLPSWNSLHTLLVARAVLLWHGASYPMLRCSSLARHRILYGRTLPCAPNRTMPLILVSYAS